MSVFVFMYSANVSSNEGGCNELVGEFTNVVDALKHCGQLALNRLDDIVYVDLMCIKTNKGSYVFHYSKRRDDADFRLAASYPVEQITYTSNAGSDGSDACPY